MKIKNIYSIIICLCCCFIITSCTDESDPLSGSNPVIPENPSTPSETLDTIDYRAWIWIEKSDLQRYGGERIFKSKLKTFFRHTTLFWNESKNKFSHYYRFVPSDDLYIYDTNGNQDKYDEFKNQAYGPMDITKHDFVVFFALNAKSNGLSCGGGGKSGQSVVMCYQTNANDIFEKQYPEKGTYSDMGHEYGHVRGAIDLYQHIIAKNDNPVTNVELVPDKCNMGTGYMEWSDYCSALFNYTAPYKQLPSDLDEKSFPKKLKISALKDGQAQRSVELKFYGTRAGGSKNNRDVYPTPYKIHRTNSSGTYEVTNIKDYYFPDANDPDIPPKEVFPYWRWFGFVIVATAADGSSDWVWLPDYKIQEYKLRTGNDIYEVVMNLK